MKRYNSILKAFKVKREPSERIIDFNPIYKDFSEEEAQAQASRCIQCPIDLLRGLNSDFPFCRTGCPLNNKIPQWLQKTYENNIEAAFQISNEMSPFPEILGRVCPKKGLCESSCTLEKSKYSAVSIGDVETYLNEKAFELGCKPSYASERKSSKKVAIVGSGPAGLSCATFLLKAGINVTIFEKEDKIGGLLTYGIPNFKLPKEAVSRRFQWMCEAGLKYHLNCEVGKDISIHALKQQYDCIFLAMGAPEGRSAGLENEYAHGVYHVMEVLTSTQKKIFNQDFQNSVLAGKDVIVIGGGDSAMDAIRIAIRNRAKSVKCIYRRDEESIPCSKNEIINAKEEGAIFIFNCAPKKILVDEHMNVTALETIATQTIERKRTLTKHLKLIEDVTTEINADIIILALGFNNKIFEFYNDLSLQLGKFNDVIVNKNYETSHPGIFAGGDVVRGADLVVTAALDGREAAFAIIEKLNSE